jgi:hypothetical protein
MKYKIEYLNILMEQNKDLGLFFLIYEICDIIIKYRLHNVLIYFL